MSQDDDEFEAKLAAIRVLYLKDGLPGQMQSVLTCCEGFIAAADKSDNLMDALAPLHAAAHKLAGSSGTFGLLETAALARQLSDYTDKNSPVISDQPKDMVENIRLLVIELKRSAESHEAG